MSIQGIHCLTAFLEIALISAKTMRSHCRQMPGQQTPDPKSSFQFLGAALKSYGVGVLARVQWISARQPRLGIATVLTLALASVAALVTVTNMMVDDVVHVETVTRVSVSTPTSPKPAPAQSTEVAETVSIMEEAARRLAATNQLSNLLDRFHSAVHDRIVARSESTEEAYKRALLKLDANAAGFASTNAKHATHSSPSLIDEIRAQRARAAQLIADSDLRRESRNRYDALLESSNTRAKTAINGSWKIFGRVVARQSLLQISADLDSLRRHTSFETQTGDLNAPASLAEEMALKRDLTENERALRSSQGDAWFGSMQSEINELIDLRVAILGELQSEQRQLRAFGEYAAKLLTQIQHQPELPRSDRPKARSAPPIAPVPPALSNTQLADKTSKSSSITSYPAEERSKRSLVAWISFGVLLFLTCICIATVASIVMPVRRLQRASAQLAAGTEVQPLPPAHITEMDLLGHSFNAMAAEVHQSRVRARDYQATLEQKVEERTRQLRILADRDPLTSLPNRRELFVLLNAAIERATENDALVGVFFIDVDNFKNINDSMGHAFGDRVLVSLAERLQSVMQPLGFAARLGGDEFTVVIDGTKDMEGIRSAGLSMVEAFHDPLVVDGRDLSVSISVGASVFPAHGRDPEALLKAADAALFRAKNLGRSQLAIFTPQLLKDAAAKFSTEQGLRRAIERGEFELAFQAEVCAETLETVLVEALIRWRTPDGRLLTPADFLAVAEESGLIVEISNWVIQTAIETASKWHHGDWPAARVAINVTNRQLIDPHFIERILELLASNDLPAQCIELELTESVLQTGPATIEALRCLRNHGIAIALDDFGTGYSSFASVEQLPLTRVKLDRTLIARIDSSPRSAAIARAIIGMCQGLGLEVTAEGIERPSQFKMLLGQRGITLQGYLISRPVPRDVTLAELANAAGRARQMVLESCATDLGSADAVDLPENIRALKVR